MCVCVCVCVCLFLCACLLAVCHSSGGGMCSYKVSLPVLLPSNFLSSLCSSTPLVCSLRWLTVAKLCFVSLAPSTDFCAYVPFPLSLRPSLLYNRTFLLPHDVVCNVLKVYLFVALETATIEILGHTLRNRDGSFGLSTSVLIKGGRV